MTTHDRRELERARRRQEILLAARALFAELGFRRTTVEQVARRADVAKGTIYLYFMSKEEMVAGLILQALDELAALLRSAADGRSVLHPEARLRAMAEAYLDFAQRAPDYFRLLTAFDSGDFGSDLPAEFNRQILAASKATLELVAQAISDGMALGVFACTDPHVAAAVLWAGLNGSLALLAHPLRRSMVDTDSPGLYHVTLDLLLCGLSRPPCGQEATVLTKEKSI